MNIKKTLFRAASCLAFAANFHTAQAQIITTIAGSGTTGFGGDGGPATAASCQMKEAPSMVKDATGNLYIADKSNFRIRKVNTSGIMSTIAGNGVFGEAGDDGPAISASITPLALAIDKVRKYLYIATQYNIVRKIDLNTGIITHVAGTGSANYFGDGAAATAAALNAPQGLAVDAAGNLFIADADNKCIRKVDITTGIISTVVGNPSISGGGVTGDGGYAVYASLGGPVGLCFDAAGNMYIADPSPHVIRKVNTSGIISTYAGMWTGSWGLSGGGSTGDDGPATAATLYNPRAMTIDSAGNMYIACAWSSTIRRVTPAGIIELFAGQINIKSYTGDGGLASIATFYEPNDVLWLPGNKLLIADKMNNVIRQIKPGTINPGSVPTTAAEAGLSASPNPATGETVISMDGTITSIDVFNLLGEKTMSVTCHTNRKSIDLSGLAPGLYFVQVNKNFQLKLVKN